MHRFAIGCLLGSVLGGTTLGNEKSRIRQREKLNHDAVTMWTSADPARS